VGTLEDATQKIPPLRRRCAGPAREEAGLETPRELEELRELDRLRSEFLALASHEIRNPAGIVSGFLDLLLTRGPELGEERFRWLLTKARDNAARVNRLADDLLTAAGIDAGGFTFDLRPTCLADLVGSTAAQMSQATGRSIELRPQPALRPALADELRQTQIMTNLLSNAVKYSPASTPVRVGIEDYEDVLLVSVSDEGPGLSEEDQRRLFEPFSRLASPDAHEAIEGSGLGLYITKALVEGQGGEIWVESDEGRGSTFAYTVLTAGPR
jgi:signal transduction histidine kinase